MTTAHEILSRYAAAVAAAVAADDWDIWTDDGSTRTVLYQWTDDVCAAFALRWDSDAGWRWARYLDTHQAETTEPTPLPVDRYASPAAVAAAMRAVLAGPDRPVPASTDRWEHADTLAATLAGGAQYSPDTVRAIAQALADAGLHSDVAREIDIEAAAYYMRVDPPETDADESAIRAALDVIYPCPLDNPRNI